MSDELELAAIHLDGFAKIEQLTEQLDSFCLKPGDDDAARIQARAMIAYKAELCRALAEHYGEQAKQLAVELG